jgi:hypothetical protein
MNQNRKKHIRVRGPFWHITIKNICSKIFLTLFLEIFEVSLNYFAGGKSVLSRIEKNLFPKILSDFYLD